MLKRNRPAIGATLYFLGMIVLGLYFTFAAVQGDNGLFKRVEVRAEAAALRAELASLQLSLGKDKIYTTQKLESGMVSPFCSSDPYPALFQNMYLPIWDNGENGTPINDQNYYARYVYRTVLEYQDDIRFWEIMNEPDFTDSPYAARPAGAEGSWFDVAPDPCDLKRLKAPVFYYIRFLRIAYEVIKTLTPDAYVAVGGIGYPSFLDAVLRYSDNPGDGAVNSGFPLTGGAYFDAVSYHSYPANDNSMRDYDFEAHAFVYSRHSDAAAAGVIRLKNDFTTVLEQRGYGSTYPAKRWIVSESNVSRKVFNDQMGSVEGQRNFVIKAMVQALQNGIDPFYTFILADSRTEASATNAWQLMGFYYDLTNTEPAQEQITPNGIAFHTAADHLHTYNRFDANITAQMALPDDIGGGAFRNIADEVLYILWAKTTIDRSEQAGTTYTFPAGMGLSGLSVRQWDYSETGQAQQLASTTISLTGSPVFLLPGNGITSTTILATEILSAVIVPNPQVAQQGQLWITLGEATLLAGDLFNSNGQWVSKLLLPRRLATGEHHLPFETDNLAAGVYFLQLQTEHGVKSIRMVVLE